MQIDVYDGEVLHQFHIADLEKRSLSALLRKKGLPLNTRCGERGLCKACLVLVKEGDEWVERQSCQIVCGNGLTVKIPASSKLIYEPQVQSDYCLGIPVALNSIFGNQGIAIAVDIGTTTVALLAIDLSSGEVVRKAAGFNQQMKLGDDVLTRINHCLIDPSYVGQLQECLIQETLIPLLKAACQDELTKIVGVVLSGNATMLHLALGENPGPMGIVPFQPVFLAKRLLNSQEIGLPFDAKVITLPSTSAYVGGDIVSGLTASGLAYTSQKALFVDVGTNGEMVILQGDKKIGCATAAGPAFEGSGLTCGVRAGRGAISHLSIQKDGENITISTEVIGGNEAGRPIGICGSAYIDFLAQARRTGLLTPTGRLVPTKGLTAQGDYGLECHIALGLGKKPIVITDSDVALLLQAKAAIAAGVKTLLSRVRLKPSDVDCLYLAGGFGMHLNLHHAVECGLLPGFHPHQIQLVGNTSLGGAVAATLDQGILADMSRLAQQIQVIELNEDPCFEETYVDSLLLD
jgi:uncharacterized 2Fe-2S/4Fe-4S cluster protein (DUF4445 family)